MPFHGARQRPPSAQDGEGFDMPSLLDGESLPALALSLVKDPLRQDFASVFLQENDGRVPDQVQMIKHLIDKGVNVDERTEDGLSALDILIDPQYNVGTHVGTVMMLLKSGASVKPESQDHFQLYASGRLYGESAHDTAQIFHARRSINPICPPERGNFYHLLADGNHQEFILINPVIHMTCDRDGNPFAREDIEMYSQWLLEVRPLDGNNPLMLSWSKVNDLLDHETKEEIENFEQYSLGELWHMTYCYMDIGGDVLAKNHAGLSIADYIEKNIAFLSAAQWEYNQVKPDGAKVILSDIQAQQLGAETPVASARTSLRPRI